MPSRLPDIYAAALRELQQLESEPLCHRIAARLLVTNCQLLDGKDEATVLTDSGRQIRDFVEAYAASLAICDLERGGFKIPSACWPLQEPALAKVSAQEDVSLHVSSSQIQACISGLRSPDSAWGTYISYRHKALQFCEAARVDQEKSELRDPCYMTVSWAFADFSLARNILIYKKLIKVTEQLTHGVEVELQKRMDNLDMMTRQASQALDDLNPKLDRIQEGLRGMAGDQDALLNALRSSAAIAHGGLEDAAALQQLLKVIIDAALDRNSQVAAAHEQSLSRAQDVDSVTERVSDQVNRLVSIVATAVASSSTLQYQLVSGSYTTVWADTY
jgi:hypothetical protein